MQNGVISTRNTSLYGSQPLSVVFAFKTATFLPELKVSMVPDLTCRFVHAKQRDLHKNKSYMGSSSHLWFCVCKTATLGLKLQVSVGPRPHLSFRACKISWLASQSLISIGPSPHLWFFDAKQWLLDQNNKSLCVQDLICRFVPAMQQD